MVSPATGAMQLRKGERRAAQMAREPHTVQLDAEAGRRAHDKRGTAIRTDALVLSKGAGPDQILQAAVSRYRLGLASEIETGAFSRGSSESSSRRRPDRDASRLRSRGADSRPS